MTPRNAIAIDPNPAIEGRLVRISVSGSGPWFISLDPSGEIQPLTLNGNEAEVMAPGVAGQTFTITNLDSPVDSAGFDIASPNP